MINTEPAPKTPFSTPDNSVNTFLAVGFVLEMKKVEPQNVKFKSALKSILQHVIRVDTSIFSATFSFVVLHFPVHI